MKRRAGSILPGGRPPAAAAASGSSGFTLLELIVTFTILGLIVVMVFGALRLGSASWERGEERAEKYQKRRIVLELLSQQVKSSYPYRIKAQKAEADYLAFRGEGDTLRFVSTFSLKTKRQEGLVFVVYRVEEGKGSGKVLKVYEKKVLTKDFMDETPNDEDFLTLADDVSDLKFEYFSDGEKKDEPGEWVESWDAKEKKMLPSQVKLNLTWKEKKEEMEAALPAVMSLSARVYDDRGKVLGPLQRPQ